MSIYTYVCNLAEVYTIRLGSHCDLVLGPREIGDTGVEVLAVILQLSYGVSRGVHRDEQRLQPNIFRLL